MLKSIWCGLFLFSLSVMSQDLPPKPLPADKVSELAISVNVQLVALDISVQDEKGGYASGLSKDDFRVYDNGKLHPIKYFSHADLPVTVGLVIDNSGSMGPKRAEVVTAALTFVHASNPQDEIFVVNFNDKVRSGLPVDVQFTDDIPTLRRALWSGPSEGRTSLHDALAYGLKYLNNGKMERKTLVVVSDGGDNASLLSSSEVLRRVEESFATIYTIGIFDETDSDRNPRFLRKLAQVSGGKYFQLPVLRDVVPVCRKIASEIRSRYTIAYCPESTDPQHATHVIKVVASAPSRQRLTVHHRSRYIMPDTNTSVKRKEVGR